jgi:hypothetical protein
LSRNSRSLTTFTTHDNIMTCFRYLKHSSTSSIPGIHLSNHLGHCITTILSISSSRRRKYQTPIPPTPHSYHTRQLTEKKKKKDNTHIFFIPPYPTPYPRLLSLSSISRGERGSQRGRSQTRICSLSYYDNNDLSVSLSNSNPVQECVNYPIQVPVPSLFSNLSSNPRFKT